MAILSNAPAERAILSGVCKFGDDAWLDVADMIQPSTFTIDSNRMIWRCMEQIFKDQSHDYVDVPMVLSAAQDLSIGAHFDRSEEAKHLSGIMNMPVQLDSVRRFAAKCRKLEVARVVRGQLDLAKEELLDVTGDESVLSIIGKAEIDFSSMMKDSENGPKRIGASIMDHLKHLADNPVEQIGIATGFPAFDNAIGGGLRPATINVIAARPKTGKTLLSDNMGYAIAKSGVPVLNLDTEMTEEDHQNRLAAMVSGCTINSIESGQFGQDPESRMRVRNAGEEIAKVPYDYMSIAGKPFEDQLSIIRRWLKKTVGLHPDGTAKPCVIIYDYLKLMDSSGISQEMQEYQMLGFMMTSLHNFAHRYQVPFLTFMQTNRVGMEKEDTSAAAGSDRIIWLCSNFTLFKMKTNDEIQEDGIENGNRKLKPIVCRHGQGMDFLNYINCAMTGENARIIEGKTKFETELERKEENEGYVDGEDGEDIPFD